jgi:hypothetical protein
MAMNTSDPLTSTFARYAQLIDGLLDPLDFSPRAERVDAVQVERGIVLPAAITGNASPDVIEHLIEVTRHANIASLKVIDAGGHQRPVYRPLLVYAWLQAFRLRYESLPQDQFGRWEESLRAWCDLQEAALGEISFPDDSLPASRGSAIADAAWMALALHVAGKVFVRDAWTDLASDTFGRLARAQQPSGAFLLATASDNPEPIWYHEFALLHAAGSYAVQAEDRTVSRAVSKSAAFLQQEVQPDHASSQPWAVFPFVWVASTVPMADQLLHAASMRTPIDGVSLILLADALYCLRLFL